MIRIIEVDGDVVEFGVTAPPGEVRVITGFFQEGDDLILSGMHIDGPGAGSLGLQTLRNLARRLGRQYSVKRVIIRGGIRTTGSKPGRQPRPIVIVVGESE